MREHTVDEMGGLVSVFLRTCLELRLFQCTVDEAVLSIHDGRLGVVARLLLHTGRGLVAGIRQVVEVLHALLARHVLAQVVEYLGVVLQQFQGQITGRVVLGDMLVGLQVFLDMTDAVLDLVAVVDVQVAEVLAGTLIHLDDGAEEFLHARTVLKRRGDHRHTEEVTERLDIHLVTAPLELVVHVQRAYHADVHIHELGGEVEVALQVGGVDDVDDHVGRLLRQMLTDEQFLRGITGEGIGTWQVCQVELIAEEGGVGLGGIDGDA